MQASNLTGRCGAIESNYLNQLSRMRRLNKRRVSKTVHFRAMCMCICVQASETVKLIKTYYTRLLSIVGAIYGKKLIGIRVKLEYALHRKVYWSVR